MPVEFAQYISQSVRSHPTRLQPTPWLKANSISIKTVLQTTFPNLNAACTASPADLAAGIATNIQNLQNNTMLAANPSTTGNLCAASVNGVNATSGKLQEGGTR